MAQPKKDHPKVSGMGSERRLASIVALDVAGYSARTEADEAESVAALRGTIERT